MECVTRNISRNEHPVRSLSRETQIQELFMSNHSGPMACPVDGTTLTMSERQGIEIDYCPTCRGVWLDRGELDKIIDRSDDRDDDDDRRPRAAQPAPPPPQQAYPPQSGYPPQYGYGKHRKPKHWLKDLFD
jgi:uncharacterized protein